MSRLERDPRLHPLSHDHHHALVLARRATEAASAAPAAAAAAWEEVLHRFRTELEPHFAVEEQHLLPSLEQAGEGSLAQRTRDEHVALRETLADETSDIATRLRRFGTFLRDHVRFEERLLFQVAQERLGDAELDAVYEACTERASPSNAQ